MEIRDASAFKYRHLQVTELRDLTERRVRFVLRRLGWLVPRAEVQISDVNGHQRRRRQALPASS